VGCVCEGVCVQSGKQCYHGFSDVAFELSSFELGLIFYRTLSRSQSMLADPLTLGRGASCTSMRMRDAVRKKRQERLHRLLIFSECKQPGVHRR